MYIPPLCTSSCCLLHLHRAEVQGLGGAAHLRARVQAPAAAAGQAGRQPGHAGRHPAARLSTLGSMIARTPRLSRRATTAHAVVELTWLSSMGPCAGPEGVHHTQGGVRGVPVPAAGHDSFLPEGQLRSGGARELLLLFSSVLFCSVVVLSNRTPSSCRVAAQHLHGMLIVCATPTWPPPPACSLWERWNTFT